MNIVGNTRRLISCGDTKTHYLLQLVLVFLIGLLNVASAYALGLVTKSLTAEDGQHLAYRFLLFAASMVLIAVLEWYRSVRMTRLRETAESNYRKITARALMHADYVNIRKLETGDLISRVVTDCRFAASNSEFLISGIRNVLIPVILIMVMFLVDWRVGLGYTLPLIRCCLSEAVQKLTVRNPPPAQGVFRDERAGQGRDCQPHYGEGLPPAG